MGGFAVLKESLGALTITVECLHINIWTLQSLNWNPTIYVDLGVRFTVESQSDGFKLRLHLPFSYNSFEDLHGQLSKSTLASLVFGEPVSASEDQIRFEDAEKGVLRVLDVQLDSEKVRRSPLASDVVLSSDHTLNPGETYYFRVRFKTKNAEAIYKAKRSGIRSNGALIDIRVNDPRSLQTETKINWKELSLDVLRTQVFVVAPAAFQNSAASPSFRYMRTLETGHWDKYLGRSPSILGSNAFIIYYWRTEEAATRVSPARFFLDITRDVGFLPFTNAIRSALVLGIVLFLFWPITAHQLSPTSNNVGISLTQLGKDLYSQALSRVRQHSLVASIPLLWVVIPKILKVARDRQSWIANIVSVIGVWDDAIFRFIYRITGGK